jgi:hypothetical protein
MTYEILENDLPLINLDDYYIIMSQNLKVTII